MDMSDLLELSKGLSKIGAKIFECFWFKLRTSGKIWFLDLVSFAGSLFFRFFPTPARGNANGISEFIKQKEQRGCSFALISGDWTTKLLGKFFRPPHGVMLMA